MDRVYITQSPMRRNIHKELVFMYDLAPAREYGELEVLLPSGPVIVEPSLMVRTLHEKLAKFQPGDHLLCLGDPVAIAAASAIVAQLNHGRIPLLVWDRTIKKYLAITVNLWSQHDALYTQSKQAHPEVGRGANTRHAA